MQIKLEREDSCTHLGTGVGLIRQENQDDIEAHEISGMPQMCLGMRVMVVPWCIHVKI